MTFVILYKIHFINKRCWDFKHIKTEKVSQTHLLFWGTWVARFIKPLTLDFSSGQDLRVVRLSPSVSMAMHGACLRVSLSLSLCPSPHHSYTLFLKKKKKISYFDNLLLVIKFSTQGSPFVLSQYEYNYFKYIAI